MPSAAVSPWLNDAAFALGGSLIVCVAALLRGPRDPRNLSFAAFASACAAFSLASLMVFYAPEPEVARVWGLRTRWWFVFTPLFLLSFALHFSGTSVRLRRWLLLGTLVPNVILSALTFSPWMVSGYVREAGFIKPIYGPAYQAFAVFTVLVGIAAFGIVLSALRTQDAYLRTRVKLFLVGIALVIGGSLVSFVLMHTVDFPLSTIGALFGVAVISYGFLTDRVWGIRSYVYQVALALLLGIGLVLPIVAVMAIALRHTLGYVPIALSALLVLAMLIGIWSFQQVRVRLSNALAVLRGPQTVVQGDALLQGAQRLIGRPRVDEVASVAVGLLEVHCEADRALIYLDRGDGMGLVLSASCGDVASVPGRLDPDEPGVAALLSLAGPTVTHRLRYESRDQVSRRALEVLVACGGDLVLPLGSPGVVRGLLVLGPARRGALYEPPELKVLHRFGQEVSTALRSASSFQAEQAERQIEHISRWISVIVHEFRNALLPARSFLEMLEDPEERGELISEFRGTAAEQLERAFTLIGELRRLQVQRPPRMTAQDLVQVVEKALRTARLQARDRGLELTWRSTVEHAPCLCDDEQLQQALLNLLNNALQHADGEPVGVELQRRPLNGAGARSEWQIAIHNAEVIDRHLLPLVFTPFFSTRGAEETPDAGFGLGMPIAQRIVHAHGGAIDVRSVPQQGTWFLVRLPTLAPEAEVA
ncbi:MAG: ATP-binding protein [Pseudomonadota bacterium]